MAFSELELKRIDKDVGVVVISFSPIHGHFFCI